jgi:integrase
MPQAPSEDFYSMEEIHRLLALPDLPPMVACALYTGMRRGELYGLTWACVRLDDPIPRIEVKHSFTGPTKNGKPRMIPIHPELLPWLLAWQQRCPLTPEQVVFPLNVRGRHRMATERDQGDNILLRKVLREAGCHDNFGRPLHAFRHSFATHLLEATGGNEDAVAKLLGHARANSAISAVTRNYTHTGISCLYRELQKMTLAPVPSRPQEQRAAP